MATTRNEIANPMMVGESQFDWEFVKSVIDVRDVFWPMTPRRAAYFTSYGVVVGGLLAATFTTGLGGALLAATRAYVIPLTVFTYGFDNFDFALMMALTRYPKLPQEELRPVDLEAQIPSIPEENKKIAVIIATHHSEGVISDTVNAWLKVVNPEQIYVMDNAKERTAPDNTQEILREINPKIHYHYEEYPNKDVAHYRGMVMVQAENAKKAENEKLDVVVPIDDDTRPNSKRTFKLQRELFKDNVEVIEYSIRAIGKNGQSTTLTCWIDNEFARSDMEKQFENRFIGPLYPHGAVYAAKLEFALEMYLYHSTHYVAQDMQIGLIVRELGKEARMGNHHFDTIVPMTYLGTPPNKWTQRVQVWLYGTQLMFLRVLEATITQWPSSFSATAALKYQQFKFIYKNLMDWFRPFFTAAAFINPLFWGVIGLITLVKTGMNLFFNFYKLSDRADLQQSFSIVATKFVDDFIEGIFTTFALMRLLMIYLPDKKTLPMIAELEKMGAFDEIRDMFDRGPHQFLTYVKVPTPVYSGLGRMFGHWENVITPVYTNTLNRIEETLDKREDGLNKQVIKVDNRTQGILLYLGGAVLAMLIAKIILHAVSDPKNKTYTTPEIVLTFVIPMVGVIGLLLASGFNKASLTAKQLSLEIPITKTYLSLFHKDAEAFAAIKENPTLVHRSVKR